MNITQEGINFPEKPQIDNNKQVLQKLDEIAKIIENNIKYPREDIDKHLPNITTQLDDYLELLNLKS